MCNILNFVYFSTLILVAVESHSIRVQNGSVVEKEHKHSKHRHHKIKPTLTDVAKKSEGIEFNLNTTEVPSVNMEGRTTEKPATGAIHEQETDSVSEESFGGSGDIPKTKSTESLPSHQISKDESSSSSDDYSDSRNHSNDGFRELNADNFSDENENINTDDVSLYVPERKTKSLDPFLDFKARTGQARPETDELEVPDAVQKSGYVPSEELTNVFKPTEHFDNNEHHVNRPVTNKKDNHLHFNNPNLSSETLYNPLANQKYLPLFFVNSNSREIPHPFMNSHERVQGNNGQQTRSYYGLTPNKQQSGCPKCTKVISSHEISNRRTADEASSVSNHARGRSAEVESSIGNEYPLVQEKYEEINRAHGSPHELVNLEIHGGYPSQEVVTAPRDARLSNHQLDPSSSKLLMTLPPFYPPSNSPLLHRFVLGGLQRFFI